MTLLSRIAPLGLLALALLAPAPSAGAQVDPALKPVAKALKAATKAYTKDQKVDSKAAAKQFKLRLKVIREDALSGALVGTAIARATHEALTSLVRDLEQATVDSTDRLSIDASEILTQASDIPAGYYVGDGGQLDKSRARMIKTCHAALKKALKQVASLGKKLRAEGLYALTAVADAQLFVSASPNRDAAYTAVGFDTKIDVVVGGSIPTVDGDGVIIAGGISDEAKGALVDLTLRDPQGAETSLQAALVQEAWEVEFLSGENLLLEGNYEIVLLHGTTRVESAIGVP